MNLLDPIGASFSLIATYLFVRANKYAWLVSLNSITINIFLYFSKGIYGDSSLEVFYLMSTFYGWYLWTHSGDDKQGMTISSITLKHALSLLLIAIVTIPGLAWLLQTYAHSQVPYYDASTTILSLIGQWLMCRKIIQTWILWFVIDALYVMLFMIKGSPFHSFGHFIYVGLAILGYFRWQKLMTTEPNASIAECQH